MRKIFSAEYLFCICIDYSFVLWYINDKLKENLHMTKKQARLKNIVEIAISQFNASESYLLDKDLSERCICAKFAM